LNRHLDGFLFEPMPQVTERRQDVASMMPRFSAEDRRAE
jgi:hypothetical protein